MELFARSTGANHVMEWESCASAINSSHASAAAKAARRLTALIETGGEGPAPPAALCQSVVNTLFSLLVPSSNRLLQARTAAATTALQAFCSDASLRRHVVAYHKAVPLLNDLLPHLDKDHRSQSPICTHADDIEIRCGAAGCLWKLAREAECQVAVCECPQVLCSLAMCLGGPAQLPAVSALWGLTLNARVCASGGHTPALLSLLASCLGGDSTHQCNQNHPDLNSSLEGGDAGVVRGRCASVVGNLAAAELCREAMIAHRDILPALVLATQPQAGWSVRRSALAALWRLVADGNDAARQRLGTLPSLIESLVDLIREGNERIASLSPNAHVPSQETQERMMYGTSMLGMLAEYSECRALIGRQPGLVQVLASLIQVGIGEGMGSSISMQVAFAVRELTQLPEIQESLGQEVSAVTMLLSLLRKDTQQQAVRAVVLAVLAILRNLSRHPPNVAVILRCEHSLHQDSRLDYDASPANQLAAILESLLHAHERHQNDTDCVASVGVLHSSSPSLPLAGDNQPTTSESAAAMESPSPPPWVKDAQRAVGEIVGHVLSVELEEVEKRSAVDVGGLELFERLASVMRLANLAAHVVMLAHPAANAAVIGPIRRLLEWSAVEAAHWGSASSASSTGEEAEISNGCLYAAWGRVVFGASIARMKHGEAVCSNADNNSNIYRFSSMEDSLLGKEGVEPRVYTSVSVEGQVPQPSGAARPEIATAGSGRHSAVGTVNSEEADDERGDIVVKNNKFQDTFRQPGLVKAAVVLLACENIERPLLLVVALSELCKRCSAEVQARILTIPDLLQGLCSQLYSGVQLPRAYLCNSAGTTNSTNSSNVLPSDDVQDLCTFKEACPEMAHAVLSLLRVFASSEKCREILAAHAGMTKSLFSVISSINAPHGVRLLGVRLLADFAQTNCHFVAAIVSRGKAVAATLTKLLLDLSVDGLSANHSIVDGRDVIRTLRAAAQGGARAEVFVSSKFSAESTNSSKDATATCCVSETVKFLHPERGADTSLEAAEAVYWISRSGSRAAAAFAACEGFGAVCVACLSYRSSAVESLFSSDYKEIDIDMLVHASCMLHVTSVMQMATSEADLPARQALVNNTLGLGQAISTTLQVGLTMSKSMYNNNAHTVESLARSPNAHFSALAGPDLGRQIVGAVLAVVSNLASNKIFAELHRDQSQTSSCFLNNLMDHFDPEAPFLDRGVPRPSRLGMSTSQLEEDKEANCDPALPAPRSFGSPLKREDLYRQGGVGNEDGVALNCNDTAIRGHAYEAEVHCQVLGVVSKLVEEEVEAARCVGGAFAFRERVAQLVQAVSSSTLLLPPLLLRAAGYAASILGGVAESANASDGEAARALEAACSLLALLRTTHRLEPSTHQLRGLRPTTPQNFPMDQQGASEAGSQTAKPPIGPGDAARIEAMHEAQANACQALCAHAQCWDKSTLLALEDELVVTMPVLVGLLEIRGGPAGARVVSAAAEAIHCVLQVGTPTLKNAIGQCPKNLHSLLETITRLGGEVSPHEVTHLASAASSATGAVAQIVGQDDLIATVAAHPLIHPAMACMLEEHSYVRLRLLFPGLMAAERPRSARHRHGAHPPNPLSHPEDTNPRVEYVPRQPRHAAQAASTVGRHAEAQGQGHWVLEEDVREVAAAVVCAIAATEFGQSLIDHPAVAEGLVALLKSERGSAQIVAVRALWGLCQLEGGSEQVGNPKLGVYKSLAMMLRSDDPDAALASAGVLGSLALIEAYRSVIGSTDGAISGLGVLLGGASKEGHKAACAALGVLACNAPVAARMASTDGILSGLVRALRCSVDSSLQIYAAGAVCNLANHKAAQGLVVAAQGLIPSLVALFSMCKNEMSEGEYFQLQLSACSAIRNLAMTERGRRDVATTPGALDTLLAILSPEVAGGVCGEDQLQLRRACAGTLVNLSSSGDAECTALVNHQQALDSLMAAIADSDTKLRRYCATIVCNLVVHLQSRTKAMQHEGLFAKVVEQIFNDSNYVNQVCYLDICRYVLSDPTQGHTHSRVFNILGMLIPHLVKLISMDGECEGSTSAAVSAAALSRALISLKGAPLFASYRCQLVGGLVNLLVNGPNSDYARAVACSNLLELTGSCDPQWAQTISGTSGVLDGLAMAARGRGARLLAAATLCHLIQRDLIQDPQQLSLLVDISVVEAMAAIMNTPGWEGLAGIARERAKPTDVNLSVVTGPELAVSALSELAALPDGCLAIVQAHGAVEGLAKALLWEDLHFATTAAAVLGHMAGDSAQARREMVASSGLIAGLCHLLTVDSTQARIYAAGTLANLAHDCSANQVTICSETGLIQSLAQMLSHTDPTAHSAAAGAIRNFAECTDTHATVLACPDILNDLSRLICEDLDEAAFDNRNDCNREGEEKMAKADAKVYALGAVGNLAQSPLGAVAVSCDEGILTALAKLLSSTNSELKMVTVAAVRNLLESRGDQDACEDESVHQRVLEVLSCIDGATEVLTALSQ